MRISSPLVPAPAWIGENKKSYRFHPMAGDAMESYVRYASSIAASVVSTHLFDGVPQ